MVCVAKITEGLNCPYCNFHQENVVSSSNSITKLCWFEIRNKEQNNMLTFYGFDTMQCLTPVQCNCLSHHHDSIYGLGFVNIQYDEA